MIALNAHAFFYGYPLSQMGYQTLHSESETLKRILIETSASWFLKEWGCRYFSQFVQSSKYLPQNIYVILPNSVMGINTYKPALMLPGSKH